jgi:hypothetical protein
VIRTEEQSRFSDDPPQEPSSGFDEVYLDEVFAIAFVAIDDRGADGVAEDLNGMELGSPFCGRR